VIAHSPSVGTQPSDRVGAPGPAAAPAGTLLIGVSGARQNASAAAVIDGRLVAFCEQERVTRVRSMALEAGALPQSALDAVLTRARRKSGDISTFATAEPSVVLPDGVLHRHVEHHRAHAAVAAFTSSFDAGVVLVCDQHSEPPVTVWQFRDGALRQEPWPWHGAGFAALYSDCASVFGFPPRSEHRLEALARIEGEVRDDGQLSAAIGYGSEGLRLDAGWRSVVSGLLGSHQTLRHTRSTAAVASSFQRRVGDALVDLVAAIHKRLPHENLCLGGGLFYNTYFNTRIVESGVFRRVFVPANPGNAGLAAGAPLAVAAETNAIPAAAADPFLGPEFGPDVIKATLDNCKLTYDYLGDREVVDVAVKALLRGELVGWFQGAMEWGPRSLGNRSILANPFAPFVLENLNAFLKQREPYRAYGLSVCVEDAPKYFSVPAASAFMELEYEPHEAAMFRHAMPEGVKRLRVQTIATQPPLFRALHRAFGEATGTGVLVNTSFNGFHEPMVCSPRDAIRVFYGGGLDMAVLGGFVLRK
jgi:carbamoyltransferase